MIFISHRNHIILIVKFRRKIRKRKNIHNLNFSQGGQGSYAEISQKSAQMTYGLLVSLQVVDKLMIYSSAIVEDILAGNYVQALILAPVGVFLDLLSTKLEYIRHIVQAAKDAPSEHK